MCLRAFHKREKKKKSVKRCLVTGNLTEKKGVVCATPSFIIASPLQEPKHKKGERGGKSPGSCFSFVLPTTLCTLHLLSPPRGITTAMSLISFVWSLRRDNRLITNKERKETTSFPFSLLDAKQCCSPLSHFFLLLRTTLSLFFFFVVPFFLPL